MQQASFSARSTCEIPMCDGPQARALTADLLKVLDSLERPSTPRKSHLRSVLPMRRQKASDMSHDPEATLMKLTPIVHRASSMSASEHSSVTSDIVNCAAILQEHAARSPELRAMALRAVAERLSRLSEPQGMSQSVASSIETVLATPPSSYLFVKDVIRIGSYQAAGLFSNSPVAVACKQRL